MRSTVETGEEGERTYFSCRSKLFHYDAGEWKERGVGTFKVNVCKAPAEEGQPEDGGEAGTSSAKKTARLIMRTEGVLRVVLNTPLFKGMKVGGPIGEEPSGKQVNLAAMEKGKTVPLMLRVRFYLHMYVLSLWPANGATTDWKPKSREGPIPYDPGAAAATAIGRRYRFTYSVSDELIWSAQLVYFLSNRDTVNAYSRGIQLEGRNCWELGGSATLLIKLYNAGYFSILHSDHLVVAPAYHGQIKT